MYKPNKQVDTLFANARCNTPLKALQLEFESKLAVFQATIAKLKLARTPTPSDYPGVYSFNSQTDTWETLEVANARKAGVARLLERRFMQEVFADSEAEEVETSIGLAQKATQGNTHLCVDNSLKHESVPLNKKLISALQQLAKTLNIEYKTQEDARLAMEVMEVITSGLNHHQGKLAPGNQIKPLSKNALCWKLRELGQKLASKGSDCHWLLVLGAVLTISIILAGGNLAAFILIPSYCALLTSLSGFTFTTLLGSHTVIATLGALWGPFFMTLGHERNRNDPKRGDDSVAKAVTDISEVWDLEPQYQTAQSFDISCKV